MVMRVLAPWGRAHRHLRPIVRCWHRKHSQRTRHSPIPRRHRMATTPRKIDHFLSSSAARMDLWRELNAKAQTWAAGARAGKAGAGKSAVEAALAEVRPLEDFFAFPGLRLLNTLS